jgi:predicted  nucleic acid-binding Zn-ribbon protein
METTKKSLKDRILAILKLDEAGKVGSFLEKQVKLINKSILVHQKNLEKFISNVKEEIEQLEEKLEDAKEALDEAYTAITLEDVHNNEAMNEFSSYYWDNIVSKENVIEKLNDQIKNCKEKIVKETESVNKAIATMQIHLIKIS